MILAFNLADIIQVPFGYLMSVLYQFTTNYGVALILFAIIVKVVLLPITAKGKKSTMKMSRMTPKLQAIQKSTQTTSRSRAKLSRPFTKKRAFPWVADACGALSLF